MKRKVKISEPFTPRERDIKRLNDELLARNAELSSKLLVLQAPPAIIPSRRRVTADDVRKFYAGRNEAVRAQGPVLNPEEWTLINIPTGLGDAVVLTDLPRSAARAGTSAKIYSHSPLFKDLVRFNPWYEDVQNPQCVALAAATARWKLGGGHNIQRAQRLFGLPVSKVPTGCIQVERVRRIEGRVSLHFDPGPHQGWQRRNIHPRARLIYPQTMAAIRRFIDAHPSMSWIEVGGRRMLEHPSVESAVGHGLEDTVRLMAECQYHLGIISGPMHVAIALGLRTIAIVNFPNPSQLMLPNLVDIGMVEEEWLYPQQVVLHQDADSSHWPKFSYRSLSAAFDGGVYPYWSHRVIEELA